MLGPETSASPAVSSASFHGLPSAFSSENSSATVSPTRNSPFGPVAPPMESMRATSSGTASPTSYSVRVGSSGSVPPPPPPPGPGGPCGPAGPRRPSQAASARNVTARTRTSAPSGVTQVAVRSVVDMAQGEAGPVARAAIHGRRVPVGLGRSEGVAGRRLVTGEAALALQGEVAHQAVRVARAAEARAAVRDRQGVGVAAVARLGLVAGGAARAVDGGQHGVPAQAEVRVVAGGWLYAVALLAGGVAVAQRALVGGPRIAAAAGASVELGPVARVARRSPVARDLGVAVGALVGERALGVAGLAGPHVDRHARVDGPVLLDVPVAP